MNTIQENVLALFRKEIPGYEDKYGNEIPLQFHSDLFDEPRDDLSDAIEEYQKEFNIDLSNVDWSHYFPWEYTPLLTRWFKVKREDIEKNRKPLTVDMFAESAKAGKWLYD
jgi:hypothetical protein